MPFPFALPARSPYPHFISPLSYPSPLHDTYHYPPLPPTLTCASHTLTTTPLLTTNSAPTFTFTFHHCFYKMVLFFIPGADGGEESET